MKSGHIAWALMAVAALAGCGPGDGGGSRGGTPARAGASPGPTATAAPSGTPDLPGSLPKFTGADTAEQAMRALVALAAAHAAGLPDSDRHPEVVTTSDSACGVGVAAAACPPTSPHEKVVVYISPEVA